MYFISLFSRQKLLRNILIDDDDDFIYHCKKCKAFV